jgi:hypothetical protein
MASNMSSFLDAFQKFMTPPFTPADEMLRAVHSQGTWGVVPHGDYLTASDPDFAVLRGLVCGLLIQEREHRRQASGPCGSDLGAT